MSLTINVFAINIKPNGKECFFGEETGTPEFYHIVDVLKKYLGENIFVSWDYNDFFFIIENIEIDFFTMENIERDEGYDETYDYITIIESIYEPFEYDPGIFIQYKNDHIVFDIIDVIDN